VYPSKVAVSFAIADVFATKVALATAVVGRTIGVAFQNPIFCVVPVPILVPVVVLNIISFASANVKPREFSVKTKALEAVNPQLLAEG